MGWAVHLSTHVTLAGFQGLASQMQSCTERDPGERNRCRLVHSVAMCMILNALAGRDLDAPPLEKHDGYNLANQRLPLSRKQQWFVLHVVLRFKECDVRLHGLVSLIFWRRTMSGASDNTEMQQLQVWEMLHGLDHSSALKACSM
eukprot:2165381-Amphidinium_carterae.2